MSNTKIGKILNKLLSEQNLRVSELARRVNLPQPTIQRIATGVCANPHESSLKPIADYFSITVDQLKGLEPIPHFEKFTKLPLIGWDEIAKWHKTKTHYTEHFVLVDVSVSATAYALNVIDGAMEPFFPRNTVLIVDPQIQPKDKSFIIATTKQSTIPVFRQLIINGSKQILKPLSPDTNIYKMLQLRDSDEILSTLVQARHNYLD